MSTLKKKTINNLEHGMLIIRLLLARQRTLAWAPVQCAHAGGYIRAYAEPPFALHHIFKDMEH